MMTKCDSKKANVQKEEYGQVIAEENNIYMFKKVHLIFITKFHFSKQKFEKTKMKKRYFYQKKGQENGKVIFQFILIRIK